MPFLTTQNRSCGLRSLTRSLRSGGSGRRPSENLAQLTPGAPWHLTQPPSENARAPACTIEGSSSDPEGISVAWRLIEAKRIWASAHLAEGGSSTVAATL